MKYNIDVSTATLLTNQNPNIKILNDFSQNHYVNDQCEQVLRFCFERKNHRAEENRIKATISQLSYPDHVYRSRWGHLHRHLEKGMVQLRQ